MMGAVKNHTELKGTIHEKITDIIKIGRAHV